MIKPFIFCLGLLMAAPAISSVHIKINQQQFRFQEPLRLSQILAPVAGNQDWYWPASRLYRLDKSVEAQRDEVINLIDRLAVDLAPRDERAIGLRALRQQVESWELAHRVKQPVSFDKARLDVRQNPMLLDGRYLLSLTPRPDVVYMSGLVKTPGPYKYQSMASASQYTRFVPLRADADPDFVYVIAPSGNVTRLDTAYWNRDYAQIMPGSQIYVPLFSYLLTPSLSELNHKIAELAVNRVL